MGKIAPPTASSAPPYEPPSSSKAKIPDPRKQGTTGFKVVFSKPNTPIRKYKL